MLSEAYFEVGLLYSDTKLKKIYTVDQILEGRAPVAHPSGPATA